jgi:hypothetical protein
LLPDLDAVTLKHNLSRSGYAKAVDGVLSPQVLLNRFVRPGADAEAVRLGWIHTKGQFQRRRLTTQVREAQRDLAENMTEETWARFHQALLEQEERDDAATDGGGR